VPQGKVKWFSTEKAFGFIEQENDNDIFVHVTGLAHGVTTLEKDQLVEYETEQGRKGPQATNVRLVTAAAGAEGGEQAAPSEEQ
jgi:cold shock protein